MLTKFIKMLLIKVSFRQKKLKPFLLESIFIMRLNAKSNLVSEMIKIFSDHNCSSDIYVWHR